MHSRRLGAVLSALVLSSCTATVVRGAGSVPSPPRAASAIATLCPAAAIPAIVECLAASLGSFWTARLHQPISEPVVLNATQAEVPVACRGVSDERAYTCSVDATVYVGTGQQRLIAARFHGIHLVIVLAWVLGHEMGHLVQYRLHVPPIDDTRVTYAGSRRLEQQADCLSGVWLARTARSEGASFVADAVSLITAISDRDEIRTHGTPAQRRTAMLRGLAGTTAGCGLRIP